MRDGGDFAKRLDVASLFLFEEPCVRCTDERPECDSSRMKKPSNSDPALCVGGNGSSASGSTFESSELSIWTQSSDRIYRRDGRAKARKVGQADKLCKVRGITDMPELGNVEARE